MGVLFVIGGEKTQTQTKAGLFYLLCVPLSARPLSFLAFPGMFYPQGSPELRPCSSTERLISFILFQPRPAFCTDVSSQGGTFPALWVWRFFFFLLFFFWIILAKFLSKVVGVFFFFFLLLAFFFFFSFLSSPYPCAASEPLSYYCSLPERRLFSKASSSSSAWV